MIIILKKDADKSQVENLKNWLKERHIAPHVSEGEHETLIGCVGDVAKIDVGLVQALNAVESVQRIQEPYKAANRKFHPEDTVVDCSGQKVGGGNFQVIAGPCSVETPEQVLAIAKAVKAAGATMLRGGAFKPRTSPYSFQGLGKRGLEILLEVRKETGLPNVTELMAIDQLPLFNDVDVIQIGARNMQNFDLLREVGAQTKKPVLLTRGMSATLLRGGAFKPRTSPYAFQGLGKKGLELLIEARKETGLPIVTELMAIETICSSLSTLHGPAITWKFPPPIFWPEQSTTVSSGWNLRFAAL